MSQRRLPRTRSVLRRLLPGRDNRLKRKNLGWLAEHTAGRGRADADKVFRRMVEVHGDHLNDHQRVELLLALERDLLAAPPAEGSSP